MNKSVFIFALLATCFNRTMTQTIEATSDIVTVREGEQLNVSCSIVLDGQSIRRVQWYRCSVLYGSVDFRNCGVSSLCPEVNTTDNRGVVNYTRGFVNEATLTLVIDHSLLRDSTSFLCGLVTMGHVLLKSDNIHVTVQHLPDPTYPMCSRSNSSTVTDILSLSCWAEITQPVVTLEWTVEGTTIDQISFSNKAEINEFQVENNLFLKGISGIPSVSLVFTCHMTSWAFPHTRRNCLVGPILIPGDQTTEGILSDVSTTTTTPFAQDGAPTTLTDLPQLLHAVFSAATSAFFGILTIILLLIVIAYLVSSRKRRFKEAEPRVDFPSTAAASCETQTDNIGQSTGLIFQNTRQPHAYENSFTPNVQQQEGDNLTGEQPSTVYAWPTDYEPVQAGGGSTQHADAQRQPRRRVPDMSAVTMGDAGSGYQALEMTNQPSSEYAKLDQSKFNV